MKVKPRKDNEVSRSYQMTLGQKQTCRSQSRVFPNRQVRRPGETRHTPAASGLTRYATASGIHSLTHFLASPDMKKLHDGVGESIPTGQHDSRWHRVVGVRQGVI